MNEIEQIVDGWKNLIFQNSVSEEIGKKRLAICMPCVYRLKATNRCGACHCYIPAAVRSSKKICIKGKW
jgi:ferredoxin-thioredoxin reductase catalytic subunit